MPDLPEPADIDQLRRQARELLRASVAGEPEAVARLRAVAERPTLAAAQLAIARAHGFPSWPALRSEVESRRQSTVQGRWSFGGAGTIEVAEGELTLGILLVGPDDASLEASLAVADAVAAARQSRRWFPELRDVTVTDDQGLTSTVRSRSGYADSARQRRFEVACALDPVPEDGSRWLDVRGRDNSVTRQLRSGRPGGRTAQAPCRLSSPACARH